MCSTVVLQMNVDLHKALIFILIQVESDKGWDMEKKPKFNKRNIFAFM